MVGFEPTKMQQSKCCALPLGDTPSRIFTICQPCRYLTSSTIIRKTVNQGFCKTFTFNLYCLNFDQKINFEFWILLFDLYSFKLYSPINVLCKHHHLYILEFNTIIIFKLLVCLSNQTNPIHFLILEYRFLYFFTLVYTYKSLMNCSLKFSTNSEYIIYIFLNLTLFNY